MSRPPVPLFRLAGAPDGDLSINTRAVRHSCRWDRGSPYRADGSASGALHSLWGRSAEDRRGDSRRRTSCSRGRWALHLCLSLRAHQSHQACIKDAPTGVDVASVLPPLHDTVALWNALLPVREENNNICHRRQFPCGFGTLSLITAHTVGRLCRSSAPVRSFLMQR